ncbi:MAG: hypothetical protein ACOYOP_05405 [Microthrixaceae bacterium]
MLILAAGFVIRVVWCIVAARTPTNFGDPFSYVQHADEIARGQGYHVWFSDVPTAYYPVGYPGLLGILLWLTRLVLPSATAMQVAIGANLAAGTATIGLVHDLTVRVVSRRAARLAAAAVALFPSLVLYSATAYLETVFTFLVVLVAWLLVGPWPAVPRPTGRRLVLLGVTLGAAGLVRPIALAALPMLLVVWWAVGAGGRRALLWTVATTGVVVVVILPWTLRSSLALGGVVAISTNTGDNLCIGHSPQSDGQYKDLDAWCWDGFETVPRDRLEVTRDAANRRAAIEFALSHPGREAQLLVRKAWFLVRHDHEGVYAVESYGADPFLAPPLRTALKVWADSWYAVVVICAAAGAVIAVRRRDRALVTLLAWAVTLLAVPLVFFGGSRFHLPALPFAAVFAAVAVDAALTRRGGRGPDPALT